jgi:hypothetical protein
MAKCWKNRRLFSSFFCCSLLLTALFPLSWAEACQSKLEARSASLFLLTTPEGADLPAGCELRDFPLLVRLNSETFDFGSARPDGSDLRFYSADGQPLAHQVEAWDPAAGSAVATRRTIIRTHRRGGSRGGASGHGDEPRRLRR